jgi:hydrogenase nickel incorporation protein HypA/HybF
MHEMSLAQSLLDIVRQEMRNHQVHRLVAVNVKAGRLNAVVPEILKTAFETLIADSPYPQAEISIDPVPLELRCGHCSRHFFPEADAPLFSLFPCPACGHDSGHTIIAGQDLFIDSIDAE